MIAIFIEPENNLKNFIIKWKSLIKKNYSNSKLTNHPPHSTIYFADLKNQKKISKELEKITLNFKPFKIKILKSKIFYNDILTNRDTICLSIKKNRHLNMLQLKIANKLKLFVKKKIKSKQLKIFKDIKCRRSQKIYGFPFVGSHWKPHFTIGSLINFKKSKDFNKFTNSRIYFENEIKFISIWKVLGEKHTRLKILRFKKK